MRAGTRTRFAAVMAAALSATTLIAVGPAQAGPNAWTQLSSGGTLTNIDEPSVARVGKSLHVVWREAAADQKESLRSRVVSGNGVAGTTIGTVVSGWDGLVENPAIVASGGKPVVVFAGLRPGWQGQLKSATYDGASWAEGADVLAQDNSAYTGYGTAATDDAGTVVVGTNGSGGAVFVNKGVPPAAADVMTDQPGSQIDLALARDRATGQVWSAWHNLSNPTDAIGVKGLAVQPVYPAVGARTKAPGSTDAAGNSVLPDRRIALAARDAADGGVWVAYAVGYPTAQTIRVWKVGTSSAQTLRVGGNIRYISLSAAPGGRMWLSWYDQNAKVLHATRSNPAVTAFGAIRTIVPPVRRGGETTVWNATSDGALGPLDLVVSAQTGTGGNTIQVWHNQILAALSVKVAPVAVTAANGGAVTITVTDAGVPVPGATVAVLGRLYQSDSAGAVRIVVARRSAVGLKRIAASRAGYFPGAAALRVT